MCTALVSLYSRSLAAKPVHRLTLEDRRSFSWNGFVKLNCFNYILGSFRFILLLPSLVYWQCYFAFVISFLLFDSLVIAHIIDYHPGDLQMIFKV